MEKVDVVIVGSGQGGVPLAVDLTNEGKSVVLFERGNVGGTCVNTGCTPSKAFLASAHSAGRARDAAKLGVHASVEVDFPAVMERVRGIIGEWRSGVEARLAKNKVRLVRAEAHFTGPNTLRAGDLEVEASTIILDTGGTPVVPKIDGLGEVPHLTSDAFFEQRERPKRLLVLGGGYIGMELGQGMARLGSHVTVLQAADRLLNNEEPDVSAVLQEAFKRDGIDVRLNVGVERFSRNGAAIVAHLSDGETIETDALLVATGRAPNTAALQLANAGVATDERGFVKIDASFRTNVPHVYAIGDVAGQPAFTHVSWEDYRRVKAILAGGTRTRDDRVLAYATYTEPQVGRAGLTLEQAKAKGHKAAARTIQIDDVARGYEWGFDLGFFRMVIDEATDKILGATLVGYEAAELVHVFVAHMQRNSTWQDLDQSVHIHPTLAEGLPSLARLFQKA